MEEKAEKTLPEQVPVQALCKRWHFQPVISTGMQQPSHLMEQLHSSPEEGSLPQSAFARQTSSFGAFEGASHLRFAAAAVAVAVRIGVSAIA